MNTFHALRKQVREAHLALHRHGLVILTWGNVSAIDRDAGAVAIKPSGVPYDKLELEQIPLVDLNGTALLSGTLRPSSDLATHLALYHAFPTIGAVAHTHSPKATAFAQAGLPVPCFGTTHADHFRGDVPVTRRLTETEVAGHYERNTGAVIAETFAGHDPMAIPAVLVASHGPFTWGRDAEEAVTNSVVLEASAAMALDTLALSAETTAIEDFLLTRHFLRKQGADAYYGQASR